jgi:hypothetical protein
MCLLTLWLCLCLCCQELTRWPATVWAASTFRTRDMVSVTWRPWLWLCALLWHAHAVLLMNMLSQACSASVGTAACSALSVYVLCPGSAVAFLKSFNLPMLVTGGGGYTKRNVARWVHIAVGVLDGAATS